MAALATSLLLQTTREFTERDIYENITRLSYFGDSRLGIGENPNKIKNIVSGEGNFEAFRKLYREPLSDFVQSQVITVCGGIDENPTFQVCYNCDFLELLFNLLHFSFLAGQAS